MVDQPAIIERHSPSFLHNKPHFTNLVTSEGGKTVHLSGLVASDAEGALIAPGDLAGQMSFIFDCVRRSLAEVGAGPADVVRQRIFVVGLQLEHRPVIARAMNDFYAGGPTASSTCVGVQALLVEGALVEIDVTAVIGNS
jgi:enamine deaminase RidA (YjgF/YER057c/UK114 family)